jgi:hypothetical protein
VYWIAPKRVERENQATMGSDNLKQKYINFTANLKFLSE